MQEVILEEDPKSSYDSANLSFGHDFDSNGEAPFLKSSSLYINVFKEPCFCSDPICIVIQNSPSVSSETTPNFKPQN